MNGMKTYKGIYVAKGSALYEAMENASKAKGDKDLAEAQAAVKKIFQETTDRFDKMYPKDHRDWFYSMHNVNKQ